MGNKTLHERLGIDVMTGLESGALYGLEQNAEVKAEDVAIMATMVQEDLKACDLPVRRVTDSVESDSTSQEVAAGI